MRDLRNDAFEFPGKLTIELFDLLGGFRRGLKGGP